MLRILQEVDGGKPVVIAAREYGLSRATIHRWKARYVGVTASELKRLKTLEEEFVARAICRWLEDSGCQTIFINPGSPWENGYIESFIDKLRDECLNREVFQNGKEAQTAVEAWRQEYSNYRPHSSLGYLTPTEFARRHYEDSQVKASLAKERAGTVAL